MRISFIIVLAGVVGLFPMQGCSVGVAMGEHPCNVDRVKVGTTQVEARAILGAPQASTPSGQGTIETYEFTDGPPEIAKLRTVFYLAADVFTAGLGEVVFWPSELLVRNALKGRAQVIYDSNAVAKEVVVTKRDGTPWKFHHSNQ